MILDHNGKTIEQDYSLRQINLNQYLQWLTSEPSHNFVSSYGSLQLSTVYSCIKLLADSIAMTPLKFYRKEVEAREQIEIVKGPFANIAKDPCPLFNTFTFWQSMLVSLNGWGNGYAVIIREGAAPQYLLYLAPNQVSMQDTTDPRYEFLRGETPFVYQVNTGQQTLYIVPEDMVHITSFSYDGITGCSPVQLHQDTFQIENEQTRYGRSFYSTGGKITGVIESPRQTSRTDAIEFVTWFNSMYGGNPGQTGSGRIAFLPNGMIFKPAGVVNPQDAEYVKARELTRKEIASIYRVPPYLIGDLERATWSNVTQLSEEFTRYTLNPLYSLIETELNRKLLGGSRTLFYEFDPSVLLRGTTSERYSNYSVGINAGFISPAEVREKEGLPYVEELDYYLRMPGADAVGEEGEEEELDFEEEEEDEERMNLAQVEELNKLKDFRDKQLERNYDLQLNQEKIKHSIELVELRNEQLTEISSEVNELRSELACYAVDGQRLQNIEQKLIELSELVNKLSDRLDQYE